MGILSAIGSALGSVSGALSPILPFVSPALTALGIGQKRSAYKSGVKAGSLTKRVQEAKALGIHPLAALGANVTVPPPAYFGDDLQRMGQNLTAAFDSFTKKKVQQEAALDVQLKRKQINLVQAQIDAIYWDLPKKGQIKEWDLGSRGQGDAIGLDAPGAKVGISASGQPESQVFKNISGIRKLLPSEKYGEAVEQSIPHQAMNTAFFIWDQAAHSDAWMMPVSSNGKKKRALIYKIQDYLFKKDGIWYVYLIKRDEWHPVGRTRKPHLIYKNQRPIHTKLAKQERR